MENGFPLNLIVGKSLDLLVIKALADSGAYGGYRTLSANSAVTALCAGVWLSQLLNWKGAGFDLTADEKDEILAMVATLEHELMTDTGGGVADYTLLEQHVFTLNTASILFDDFEGGDYVRYELVLSNLHSSRSNAWYDPLTITFNGDELAGSYDTVSNTVGVGGLVVTPYMGTQIGFRCHGVCAGADEGHLVVGNFKMTIFQPQGDYWKHVQFEGGIMSVTPDIFATCYGVGIWEKRAIITEIEIVPTVGVTFYVAPHPSDLPHELVASLYGVT